MSGRTTSAQLSRILAEWTYSERALIPSAGLRRRPFCTGPGLRSCVLAGPLGKRFHEFSATVYEWHPLRPGLRLRRARSGHGTRRLSRSGAPLDIPVSPYGLTMTSSRDFSVTLGHQQLKRCLKQRWTQRDGVGDEAGPTKFMNQIGCGARSLRPLDDDFGIAGRTRVVRLEGRAIQSPGRR